MPKRTLIEQLDDAVQAMLAEPEGRLPKVDQRIAPLLQIASELRDLPREVFKARLKADLVRPTSAPARQEARFSHVHSAVPYLSVRGASEAIEFYKKAFGATEVM